MSKIPDRYDGMLFDYETSNRTDFHDGEILPIVKTVAKKKPARRTDLKPPPLKDLHTLSVWKTSSVPFDLLIKAKDITRTNPWIVQQRYVKSPDLGWENAKNTRPRLVMTPAVSMDDITDAESRRILIQDIYTTTVQRAMREGVADALSDNVRAPLPGPYACSNPITLEKYQPPLVSAEWRMDTVTWDGRQLRGHCDPDKEFYLGRSKK